MKKSMLLPRFWKPWGWVLTLPALVAGIAYLIAGDDLMLSFLRVQTNRTPDLLNNPTENLTNELIGLALLIGLNLVAFSQEKVEDERVAQIRLESWLWGLLINSILLALALIFLYGEQFFNFMICNLYTPYIIYLVRFHLVLYAKSSWENTPKLV